MNNLRARSLCEIIKADQPTEDNSKGSLPPDFQIKVPKYTNCKKEYPTKTKTPMKIHERAILIRGFDRKAIEEIPPNVQKVDFLNLLCQFRDIEEINNLQINDVLGLDTEILADMKGKCSQFLDAASTIIQDKQSKIDENANEEEKPDDDDMRTDEELMNYLSNKVNDLNQSDINFKIVLNNLDHIQYLVYSPDGAYIYWKNENNK